MSDVQQAVAALRTGGVIAYPTEAVFGLGCDPANTAALQNVIDIKGRDAHKGFILIASAQTQLQPFIAPISTIQQKTLDKYWPGPVTFVMPASEEHGNTLLSGYRQSLAVRVSTHPLVVELCEQFGGAIVSTSANVSGQEAMRSAEEVGLAMGNQLDVIVDGKVGSLDSPTRIVDLMTGQFLR